MPTTSQHHVDETPTGTTEPDEQRTVRIPGSTDHAGHHLITVTLRWVCPTLRRTARAGPRRRSPTTDPAGWLATAGATPAATSTTTPPSAPRPNASAETP